MHKLCTFEKNGAFFVHINFLKPLFYGYFPQHCLYFLPEPHAPFLSILLLYLVHIVLWLLALFYGHLVHIIISIICIINITNNLFNVDKMWTKSSYILSFVSKKIISYIDAANSKSTTLQLEGFSMKRGRVYNFGDAGDAAITHGKEDTI